MSATLEKEMKSCIVAFFLVLQFVSADCIRLEKDCLSGSKTTYQINNSTNYYSFYVDEITSYYSKEDCSANALVYQVITHRTYDTTYCMGTAESVWYKVIDKNDVKQNAIVEACGSSLTKKFVDVTSLNCKVDGADPFSSLSSTVNTQRYSCIKFNQKQPEISGTSKSSEKCDSDFDMGSSWISDFVIVIFVVLGVLVVCVVILIVYVILSPRKKSMKKETKV